MLLLWTALASAAPPCATFDPTLPTAIDTDPTCDGVNLVVGPTDLLCSGDCSVGTVTLWVPVDNVGNADAGAFEVRLFRRRTDSVSEIVREEVGALSSGARLVLGPYELDRQTWGDGVVEIRVDAIAEVEECAEDDNVGNYGAFDPAPVDLDADGYRAIACGGTDCDDDDPTQYPGATDIVADGIDQDCDGADDNDTNCDFDADGTRSLACGGLDCNDGDPDIRPDAEDIADDGIDQDCDGLDACTDGPSVETGCSCDARGGSPAWAALLLVGLLRRRSDAKGVRA
jgi:hypothetical protein